MPVMDGLEAASIIAGMDIETPVVAMTANIMAGETEKFKAHGIPDWMSKPFTSQELWECLLKYIKPVGEQLNINDAEDDTALLKRLKVNFARANTGKYKEIDAAIGSGNVEIAHRLVHTLKSNAGQIGEKRLQKAAADLEAAFKELLNGGKVDTHRGLAVLKKELTDVLDRLSPFLAAPSPAESKNALAPEEARALLQRLKPMLHDGSTGCLKLIDDLHLVPGSEALIAQMESFDFDMAAETLEGLINTL
jgi:CheY-like chemotaxis protein